MFDCFVILSVTVSKQLKLSERVPSRSLVVTSEDLLFWSARAAAADSTHDWDSHRTIADSDETQQPIRLLLIILHRRSERVGLVLSVCGFRANSIVLEMLIQAPGNLLCFAVELGFFMRDHPTPFTTTVATGPATVEYKQHRISTAHVAAAPR